MTQRFRELLAEKSGLVNKESLQQEVSYVLEAFFDICQRDGLDLSSAMLSSKQRKYNVIDGVRELDHTDTHETFLMPIIVDQSTSETRLEELIKKHCNPITEAEGNKFAYTTKYTNLPSSLIIHFSHCGKASSLIPMDFTFPKECIEEGSTHEYVLEAFAVHLGSTHESGHFIAYRKVNGQWKKFDDSQVTDVNENQLQQLLGNFQGKELEHSNPYAAFQKESEYQKFDNHTLIDFSDENQLQQLLGNFQGEEPGHFNPYAAFQKESECQQADSHALKEQSSFLYKLLGKAESFFKGDLNPYVCMLSYSKK